MSKVLPLIEKGSKVTVDLDRVLDRIPTNLLEVLSADPLGMVVDYKMTDGTGIGLVLKLSDGSINWFFVEELGALEGVCLPLLSDHQGYKKADSYNLSIDASEKVNIPVQMYEKSFLTGNGVVDLMNPVNFFKWLLYSLKDVY